MSFQMNCTNLIYSLSHFICTHTSSYLSFIYFATCLLHHMGYFFIVYSTHNVSLHQRFALFRLLKVCLRLHISLLYFVLKNNKNKSSKQQPLKHWTRLPRILKFCLFIFSVKFQAISDLGDLEIYIAVLNIEDTGVRWDSGGERMLLLKWFISLTNLQCHVKVCIFVHINMANPFRMS